MIEGPKRELEEDVATAASKMMGRNLPGVALLDIAERSH